MENTAAYILITIITFMAILSVFKSKSNNLAIIMLLFMWSLCIFCTNAFDLNNMKYIYEHYSSLTENYAIGYDLFIRVCIKLGFSFTVFKAIIGAFSLILSYLAIRKGTNNVSLVIGLYAVYPFLGTITQIRNGMMAAIVIYSIIYFITDPYHNIWKYILGIGVACLFHWSAVFYFILIFAKVKIKKMYLFIFLITLFIIIYSIIYFNLLYPILSHFILNERILQWFDFSKILTWATPEKYNWKSKIILVIFQIIGYLLFDSVYSNFRKCLKHPKFILLSTSVQKVYFTDKSLVFFHKIEMLLFCILPLYLLTPTFFRMYYDVLLLLYIISAQYFSVALSINYKVITAKWICTGVLFYAFFLAFMINFMQGGIIEMLNSYRPFL